MKNVRNGVAVMILALVYALMSCDEAVNPDVAEAALASSALDYPTEADTQNWDTVATATLPQVVTDYVSANYAEEEILASWRTEEDDYIVRLTGRIVLAFDSDGNFLERVERGQRHKKGERKRPEPKGDSIAVADLGQNIREYIATNYPDDTIEGARKNDRGFCVKMESGIALFFDAEGNFVEEKEAPEGGPEERREGQRRGHDFEDWDAITTAELPQVILDYVAANYPDASILVAAINSENGNYGVVLDAEVALLFDSDGNFVNAREAGDRRGEHEERCKTIDVADLPVAITDYLTANYAEASIDKALFNDRHQEYVLELSTKVTVFFDAEGNFIRERTHG